MPEIAKQILSRFEESNQNKKQQVNIQKKKNMASLGGFEPPTFRSEAGRSIQAKLQAHKKGY